MKYTTLLSVSVFLFFLTVPVVQAQTFFDDKQEVQERGEVRLGLRAGLSIYSIETEISTGLFGTIGSSSNNRTGFTGGLFIEIPVSERWFFQPELLFVQKGGAALMI